ncbi:triose-phosphate isomerase [Aestuariibius sp. 2305UL40-4]|uniref:triose-phosphate isomerase n=1 Tax=Aestuariibius violaceus TaxID=3234132 RepID=UPI00345E8F4D
MPQKIAAGNWKMNAPDSAEVQKLLDAHPAPSVSILLCPPATLLAQLSKYLDGTPIATGGQDCHTAASGAHTGDVSADMLRAAGATHVIVGHSERRADHGETDALIRAKAEAALNAGLTPILCIGETLEERDAGQTLDVVARQLTDGRPETGTIVIAYEPVWAIGTGRTPTTDQIAEVHALLRDHAPDTPLLYGGSVKGANAAEIFAIPNVDGALVGGASLTADAFSPIIAALEAS